MSYSVEASSLTQDWKDYIKSVCNVKNPPTAYDEDPPPLTIFKVEKSNDVKKVILPLFLWNVMLDSFPNNFKFSKIDNPDVKFQGELIETETRDQKTVIAEAIEKLEKQHCCLLNLFTGFGKTASAIYLITHFKLRTVILCHMTSLHEQWKRELLKYSPSLKVKIVTSPKEKFTDADVFIVGVIRTSHFDKELLKHIGFLVVDEAHLCFTELFSSALLNFSPKYLLALSATPDRITGRSELLYPFFGNPEDFIVRFQTKNFTVIKINTGFKPEITHSYDGKLSWSNIINSIAYNKQRQEFIVSLCKRFANEKILIISSRVCGIVGCKNNGSCGCSEKRSYGIVPLLIEAGESVSTRVGNQKTHDESARILIGTRQKLSTGYDSQRDLLILDDDIQDPRQVEGRIRKHNNFVIDLVDSFKPFEKHYKLREEWYRLRGAKIEIENRLKTSLLPSTEISEHKRFL